MWFENICIHFQSIHNVNYRRQSGQESYIGTLHGAFISKDEEIISIFNAHKTLIITKSCIHMEQKLRNAVSILSKIA